MLHGVIIAIFYDLRKSFAILFYLKKDLIFDKISLLRFDI